MMQRLVQLLSKSSRHPFVGAERRALVSLGSQKPSRWRMVHNNNNNNNNNCVTEKRWFSSSKASTTTTTTILTPEEIKATDDETIQQQQDDDDDLLDLDLSLEGSSRPSLDFSDGQFPSPPPIQDRMNAAAPSSQSPSSSSSLIPPPTPTASTAACIVDGTDADIYSPLHVEPMSVPEELMERIEKQEWQGGRMKAAQHGVLHEDPKVDMRLLMENYSVASLASALRDREDVLQQCAILAEEGDTETLHKVLRSFHPRYLLQRRTRKRQLDVCKPLTTGSLEVIRKALMRMPRTVTTAHTQRAGVVIPLCISNGVPSLLLEKRSPDLRAHPDEVCLPGGMVCSINDATIISTCLREMKEEIPGLNMNNVEVLGVLRCNWGEVHHLVGVAVTPVVCYLGEVSDDLHHNSDEVAKVFTIPLSNLLKNDLWVQKQDLAPIFVGGPEIIWGLTGYILDRFVKDIVLPNHVRKDHHLHHHSLRNI